MASHKRGEIAAILEQRISRAVASGALRAGDRLPSIRKAAADLGADPRAVLAAYRRLSEIGMVTLAPRSGIYLSKSAVNSDDEKPPTDGWLVDTIAAGIFNGFPISVLSKRVESLAGSSKLRVVVVALTVDQAMGLARELHSDFGFETSYVLADALRPDKPVPRALKDAHVFITTQRFANDVEPLAKRMKKIAVVVKVRPDVIASEWVMLLEHPVYVVGMDSRLLELIKAYLRDVPGSVNMVMMVAGHDDLSKIPPDAPTYVTEAARRFLGKTNIPGRLIKPGKLLDRESVLRLAELLVARGA
ncbi:MAG: GntR family transcriptional regulator [Gemmatimonadota bacterium]|nr:GntR family transcriptional regulator [Gemmatimonadota bacterium]